jgi:hypothetical protein
MKRAFSIQNGLASMRIVVRIALCCLLLLGGFGTGSAPLSGLGRLVASESEAPAEEFHSPGDAAIRSEARFEQRRDDVLANVAHSSGRRGQASVAFRSAGTSVHGHRWANGLCAPLRC